MALWVWATSLIQSFFVGGERGCRTVCATVMNLTVLVSDQCTSPMLLNGYRPGLLTAPITKSPERLVKHLLKSIQAHLVPLHLAYGSDRRVDALHLMRFLHSERTPKLWSTFLSCQTRSNSGQRCSWMNIWRWLDDVFPFTGSPLGCVLSLLLEIHNCHSTADLRCHILTYADDSVIVSLHFSQISTLALLSASHSCPVLLPWGCVKIVWRKLHLSCQLCFFNSTKHFSYERNKIKSLWHYRIPASCD